MSPILVTVKVVLPALSDVSNYRIPEMGMQWQKKYCEFYHRSHAALQRIAIKNATNSISTVSVSPIHYAPS